MRRHHLNRLTVIALAALATALPAGQAAAASPDDRPFARATLATAPQKSVGPDDRPFARGTVDTRAESGGRQSSISLNDRAHFRGLAAQRSNSVVSSDSGEFQWRAAGVGAATMLGFLVLIGATTRVVRHQRNGMTAS